MNDAYAHRRTTFNLYAISSECNKARELYFASYLDANSKIAARNTDYFTAETLA